MGAKEASEKINQQLRGFKHRYDDSDQEISDSYFSANSMNMDLSFDEFIEMEDELDDFDLYGYFIRVRILNSFKIKYG